MGSQLNSKSVSVIRSLSVCRTARLYLLSQFTRVAQPRVGEQGFTSGKVDTSDIPFKLVIGLLRQQHYVFLTVTQWRYGNHIFL